MRNLSDTIREAKDKLGQGAIDIIVKDLNIEKWDGKKGCCAFHAEKTPSMIWCDEDRHGNTNYLKCFAAETKVITREGVLDIGDIIDCPVDIINGNGDWETTIFRDCGEQQLMKISLSSNGKTKTIFATKDHEWIVQKYKKKLKTISLKQGMRLSRQWVRHKSSITPDINGIRHGFIYGDGCVSKKHSYKSFYHTVNIFNENKLQFCKTVFDSVHTPKKNDYGYIGHINCNLEYNAKIVPDPKSHSLEYLMGFMVGCFVSDGNCSDETIQISSAKHDDLIKIKHILTLLGIPTYPIGKTTRTIDSNMGVVKISANHTMYNIRLVKSEVPEFFYFGSKTPKTASKYSSYLGHTVISVDDTDRVERVYCCETSTQSFVLDGFILTGNCFGCGKKYDIIDHYMQYDNLSFQEATKTLCESVDVDFDIVQKTNREDWMVGYKYPKEVTNTSRSRAEAYLNKRHISSVTMDYAGIKEDSDGNIVFEYRDFDNTLLNVKYRPARRVQKGQAKMWLQKEASNCPSLFNMHKVDITKPLLICEGEIDAISVIEAGEYNVVSVPYGANDMQWIEFNYDWLDQFQKIVLWFDDDEAGKKALKEVSPRLGVHRTYYVSVTDEIKTKLTTAFNMRKIANDKCDANNVLIACDKQDMLWLLTNAKENENENLTRLLDYDELDIQNMEKYPSGIAAFDNILFGTLFNTLTIVTGKPGSGKSVLVNLLGVHSAVDAGHKAMIFSGELKPEFLSGWMLRPFAGDKHIIEWKNEGRPSGYSVTNQAKQAIRDKYRDDIILFRKKTKGFSTKPQDLYDAIEYSYKKYGCRTFTIDNMMCVSFGFGDKQYDEQRQFVGELIDLAERLPIAIILAVHTTKDDANVSGVSEILRMAHRCIYDRRLDGEDGYHALIEVWKERIVGGTAGKKIKLYYDIPTMRLYSNQYDLNKEYSWAKDFHINYSKEFAANLVLHTKDDTSEVLGDI